MATFATIANMRSGKEANNYPMGYVLDTPSGSLKRLLVEKIDSIETTLAHAVPELTSNATAAFAVVYLIVFRLATLLLLCSHYYCGTCLFIRHDEKDYDYWYQNTIVTEK